MIPTLSLKDIENIEICIDCYNIELEKIIHAINNVNITMQQYHELTIEIQCIEHDLYVYNLSLEMGYDIMKYGMIEIENTETDGDSSEYTIAKTN